MFVFLSAIFKVKINITASYVPCQNSNCDLCDLYIGYLVLASIGIDPESKRNTTKGGGEEWLIMRSILGIFIFEKDSYTVNFDHLTSSHFSIYGPIFVILAPKFPEKTHLEYEHKIKNCDFYPKIVVSPVFPLLKWDKCMGTSKKLQRTWWLKGGEYCKFYFRHFLCQRYEILHVGY